MAVKHMAAVPRCTATSKTTGIRCKQAAIRGGQVCIVHGGGSPAAQAAAKLRIAMLVDPALEVMFELLSSPKTSDAVRLSTAKDILDRAGFKPVEKTENAHFWDGDPSKLNESQGDVLKQYLLRLAFGDDQARMMEMEQRVLAAGTTVDVEFEPAVEKPVDSVENQNETEDGW